MIDEEFRDTAGELRVDVNQVGFKAAISPSNSKRQAQVMLVPPKPADTHAGDDYRQGQKRKTQLPALMSRRWVLDDGRETALPLGRLDRDTEPFGSISGMRVLIGHQIG